MSRVVYVDDESTLCGLVARILRRASIDVVTFTDPREALAYINEHAPALVLCDHRMPEMSGLTLYGRLEVEVQFVLISGDLDVREFEGIDVELLSKPIHPEDLVAFVRARI